MSSSPPPSLNSRTGVFALRLLRLPLLLLILLGSGPPVFSAEPASTRLDRIVEALQSVGPEMDNQFAMARAELEAMREEDGWTAADREAAQLWLKELLPSHFVAMPGRPVQFTGQLWQGMVLYNARRRHRLSPPGAVFAEEMAARLASIREVRRLLWIEYNERVSSAAEDAWLEAKQPADLAPILRQLAIVRTVGADVKPIQPGRPVPVPSELDTGRFLTPSDDLMGAVLILSGPEPLLLPDPAIDPAGYKKARALWGDLEPWQFSFCQRPRVVARVSEYDTKFDQVARAALRKLDRLMIEQAPVAILQQAVQDLESYRLSNGESANQFVNMTVRTPMPGPALLMKPVGVFPADYRQFLSGLPPGFSSSPSSRHQPARGLLSSQVDSCRRVVDFLASEAGAAPGATPGRTPPPLSLLGSFEGAVKAALAKRLLGGAPPIPDSPKRAPSRAIVIDAAAPPYEAVSQALEMFAAAPGNGSYSARAKLALDAWRGLRADAPGNAGLTGQPADSWASLATMEGGPSLLAARDRAVLALLAVPGAKDTPSPGALAPFLRDCLEEAVSAEDWSRCERVLAVNRVIEVLPAAEQTQWLNCVTVLNNTGAEPAAGDPAGARRAYLEILRQTVSPGAARLAAQRIKALPKTAP